MLTRSPLDSTAETPVLTITLVHDYGTIVAQELLYRNSDNQTSPTVLSLVAMNAAIYPDLTQPKLIQKLLLTPLGPLLTNIIKQRLYCKSLTSVFGAQTKPSEEALALYWENMHFANGNKLLHKLISYISQRFANVERWSEHFGNCVENNTLPFMLVNGDGDAVVNAAAIDALRVRIKNIDIKIVSSTGHYAHVEQPLAVWDLCTEFWAEQGCTSK